MQSYTFYANLRALPCVRPRHMSHQPNHVSTIFRLGCTRVEEVKKNKKVTKVLYVAISWGDPYLSGGNDT